MGPDSVFVIVVALCVIVGTLGYLLLTRSRRYECDHCYSFVEEGDMYLLRVPIHGVLEDVRFCEVCYHAAGGDVNQIVESLLDRVRERGFKRRNCGRA